MKKPTLAIMASMVITLAFSQTTSDRQMAAALLKRMTLEEKIGQMTQVTIAVITTNGWGNQDGSIDPAALKKAVVDYKVGSILNVVGHAFSDDQWRSIISLIQDESRKTRLKIPVLYGLDGIHGQTYTLNSTLFPQNIAMAASRNPELVARAAKVTAKELRASGVRWNFAPVLDCGRQPLWSRLPETYGEDVYIGTQMGSAAIRAYEEDGLRHVTAVASCMKHFLGYSAPRSGKDRTPAYLPEIEMREYYLPQFRAAIKAGASSIMINSGEINGVPVHASRYLLHDVLRKELGFEGVVVSDWEDIIRLHNRHDVAATPREAVAMAVNAGIDMSMVPSDFSFFDLLREAVKKGEVPLTRIDEAVTRILLLKYKLGLFDNPYPEKEAISNFGRPEYQELALQAAREALTLLKNEQQVLPLSKNSKVLVAGPAAQSISALNGCWSYTWQGNEEKWYPEGSKTIAQAIIDKLGAGKVINVTSAGFDNPANFDASKISAAAADADAIILCLGENAYAESPGNIRDLALPANQVKLAEAAQATGKPVILVLTEGRPRLISTIEPGMKGILLAYWSGRKAAEAIADVLFGDYNPDGKLPYSYPRSMGEMVLYDRKHSEDIREIFNENVTWNGYDPLFPFGWGLSYTSFEYGPLQLSAPVIKGNQKLKIRIAVKNSGTRDGKTTIELYTHDLYASITPSMRRLRKFSKIFIKAGETQTVEFELDRNDLSFVNGQLKTVTEPGEFEVFIGDRNARFTYSL